MDRTDADSRWVERARAGDRAALERLIRRHDAFVLNLAWRLLGDAERAQDVRQAVFLKLAGAIATFDGASRLETWLYRVALNAARDLARSESARRAEPLDGDDVRATGPTADVLAERGESTRAVVAAVIGLPSDEREVLVLRHYEDLSFVEIAELLGVPVTTAKSRMRRALERLRPRLSNLMIHEESTDGL